AFPFALPGSPQRRPQYAVVADGESIDLNRAQIMYKVKDFALTVGRQRINLDDQRFIGSVGWRQNEQTFDAVRAEATVGPVSIDATYAIQQDSIFGSEAGPRRSMDGDFV
ncbi:MAG: alginate export family protein, partial [Novosphingobium sp.]